MSETTIQSLSDLIEIHGEKKIQQLLATFKSRNEDVESFLTDKRKAITFDKYNISRVYLLLETDAAITKLRGYISLSFKSVYIEENTVISNRKKGRLGVSPDEDSFIALLIAQYGKNQNEIHECDPKQLLGYAIDLSIETQKKIGGLTTILLECEKSNDKLNLYYEKLGFQRLQFSNKLSQYYIFINKGTEPIRGYSESH
ncbi:hypothetical protein AB4027_06005 [Alkalibacterium putridalgicola]|uniref:hypothetical protein n=1 Tax=Alkalibacterium putridalgicola TaxID=426703 RepID=UPI0034D0083F